MNLKGFHVVLITASAALASLFGVWCLEASGTGTGSLVAGAAAFAVRGLALVYEAWFLRKTRRLR